MDSVVHSRSTTSNWEYKATGRPPASLSDRSSRPPPPSASRHDNSPTPYYASVRGQAMKSARHQSGLVNNQRQLYTTVKDSLQCHEGQPSSSSNGRSEFLDLNYKSVESSLKEKFLTRKAWVMHPVDDTKSSNSSGSLEFDCIVPGPSERDVYHLNKHMASQPAVNFPSPNTMCTSNLYVEAKESFANAEVSEEESTIEKSVGSDKVSSSYDIDSRKTGFYRESSGSDVSDESSSSPISSNMYKPHKANDGRWEAIQAVKSREGALEFKNFRLLMRLGCGDIGSVYLAELIGTRTFFAMKVMDKAALVARKKVLRALTEREILQSLDHPFLPTLYTHFDTQKSSCLLMEFCPGGDLHALRQRQPGRCFPEHAARFYVAEVLLALEYLHMLGIIYRDLKPENVLVREDGHIMLSDFDLSLRCAVCPTLVKSSGVGFVSKNASHCAQAACIEPTCVIQPDCIQPACFGPRFLSGKSKKDKKSKPKNETNNQATPLPELIAEPTNARSMSFVGTHEYLAPEIIKGEGHGSAVDWWTFGIFLYELLFGKTPFKGAGNRATLFNVIGQPLTFPESPNVSIAARDLIRGLLVKEPQNRLAYRRGATEIKQHPFFQNVNWALIRCTNPPEVPQAAMLELQLRADSPKPTAVGSGENVEGPYVKPSGNYYEIDLF